ncbi:MAG: hypothetical protein KF765_14160 [Parvibaculaceae bacterium]|nr:hypothetical protein [Parvibaculaceae bacterium]
MPVSVKSFSSRECDFAEWSINKRNRHKLVEIIAFLYLRQEENAQRVINALEPRRRIPKGNVAENVVRKLTAPRQNDVDLARTGSTEERAAAKRRIEISIIHRDGLLFQHISWVVARMAMPAAYMTAPHVRQADKGFDGFIIELDEAKSGIGRIVLCEDKASITPRKLISSSVWPDVEAIRRGDRDDEILADLVTLLKSVDDIDVEAAVDEIFWEEVREFRVAVATGENRRKSGSFLHIVAGFETVAGGPLESRTAGVLPFDDVRAGLAILAEDVAAKVKEIAGV